MASNAKRAWIGGTAFAAAVLAAGSWFFAVSPNLTAASERRAEAEDTRAFNDVLNLKLAKLKSDFGKLDTYKADLAAPRRRSRRRRSWRRTWTASTRSRSPAG
ncbi:MAG: hypothetical protein NVV70_04160 [Cellulomonas sp.]|nr:hypothetical protein [Cellulomonas sp.]MCR6647360.1 hypothetical protein [Cellulomonas sp.]